MKKLNKKKRNEVRLLIKRAIRDLETAKAMTFKAYASHEVTYQIGASIIVLGDALVSLSKTKIKQKDNGHHESEHTTKIPANGASVSEKTSDESNRKQAMLIWTNPYSDVIFCQDEETRKNPFEKEVEILRDFGHNVDLKTYKQKLTERGYEWCEIMHYNDRSATRICDASDGYVFNHCYSGMKVGDTKVW